MEKEMPIAQLTLECDKLNRPLDICHMRQCEKFCMFLNQFY